MKKCYVTVLYNGGVHQSSIERVRTGWPCKQRTAILNGKIDDVVVSYLFIICLDDCLHIDTAYYAEWLLLLAHSLSSSVTHTTHINKKKCKFTIWIHLNIITIFNIYLIQIILLLSNGLHRDLWLLIISIFTTARGGHKGTQNTKLTKLKKKHHKFTFDLLQCSPPKMNCEEFWICWKLAICPWYPKSTTPFSTLASSFSELSGTSENCFPLMWPPRVSKWSLNWVKMDKIM